MIVTCDCLYQGEWIPLPMRKTPQRRTNAFNCSHGLWKETLQSIIQIYPDHCSETCGQTPSPYGCEKTDKRPHWMVFPHVQVVWSHFGGDVFFEMIFDSQRFLAFWTYFFTQQFQRGSCILWTTTSISPSMWLVQSSILQRSLCAG